MITTETGKTELISRQQRTAYHEAAHAVAALHVGIEFEYIALIPDDAETMGRMRRNSFQLGGDIQELLISLAGPAAEERMFRLWGDGDDTLETYPAYVWEQVWETSIGSAAGDVTRALKIVEDGLGRQAGRRGEQEAWRSLMGIVRSTVGPFVRKEWNRIVTLGDALVSAPDQTLAYDECRVVLGLDEAAAA